MIDDDDDDMDDELENEEEDELDDQDDEDDEEEAQEEEEPISLLEFLKKSKSAALIRKGVNAFNGIKRTEQKNYILWKEKVGPAYQKCSRLAMQFSGSTARIGRGYNQALSQILEHFKFYLPETTRADLLWIMEHLEEVEEWRERQPDKHDLNNPSIIRRKIQSSSKQVDDKSKKRKPSSAALQKEEVLRLTQDVEALTHQLQEERTDRDWEAKHEEPQRDLEETPLHEWLDLRFRFLLDTMRDVGNWPMGTSPGCIGRLVAQLDVLGEEAVALAKRQPLELPAPDIQQKAH